MRLSDPRHTTKATRTSIRLLRLIAADADELQYKTLERVLTEEARKRGLIRDDKSATDEYKQ